MAVYSNIQIKHAVANGHIVCVPYNEQYVSRASLDVTLGYWHYRLDNQNDRPIYNPYDKEDVGRNFKGPFKALTHAQWIDQNGYKPFEGIPLEQPIIVLKPQERILTHTHEFIGIKPPGACEVRSRSTTGRNGLAVCFDASWSNPGDINRMTLEMYNLNQHKSIVIPVGERVAQIIFHETGDVEGKNGLDIDIEELIQTWAPDQMLPKAYLDKRSMPNPVEGMDE